MKKKKQKQKIKNKCLSCIFRENNKCIKRDLNIFVDETQPCIYYDKQQKRTIINFILGGLSSFIIFKFVNNFSKKK